MTFSEIDANGWAVIIAAIFLGIQQTLGMILTWKRSKTVETAVSVVHDTAQATLDESKNTTQVVGEVGQKLREDNHKSLTTVAQAALTAAEVVAAKSAEQNKALIDAVIRSKDK